jgi:hypothetical protein
MSDVNDVQEPGAVTIAPASDDEKARLRPRRITKRMMRKLDKEEKERKTEWGRTNLAPLERLIRWGVPSTSLNLYAKWWQLERWLRDLAQLELQARFKREWKDQILQIHRRHERQTAGVRYMRSSDDPNALGFADLGDLRTLIDAHWDLFEYALPPQVRWTGTIDTLVAVRHRIAHCRTPHKDDLARVDQALRDLEDGVRACLQSYAAWEQITAQSDPHLTTFSLGEPHQGRLEHARDQYETTLTLHRTKRPWSTDAKPGILYHAQFHCNKRPPDPAHVWDYLRVIEEIQDLVHLNFYAFNSVEAVFTPATPDAAVRLIDSVLEAVLVSERPRSDEWYENWASAAQSLDYRIHADDYFANAMDLSRAPTIFFAER